MKLATRAWISCAAVLLTSTSSAASTSETVTAASYTSPSSTLYEDFECTIDIKLYDPQEIESVYFAIDASPLTCTSQVPGVVVTRVYNPTHGWRLEGFPEGFQGPVTIASCVAEYYHYDCPPLLEQLNVTVYEAQGPDGPLAEMPSICAQRVDCTLWPCMQGPLVADACGDPDRSGTVHAMDALITLRAAVSLTICPATQCDADRSGRVTTADALAVLRVAVGLEADLHCPAPC